MAKATANAREMRSERAKLALQRRIDAAMSELQRDFPTTSPMGRRRCTIYSEVASAVQQKIGIAAPEKDYLTS
ncbi:MAG: hypothetical protein M3Q69_17755 [Acidobacteriota bacterium]|nr:hypothetical protein [Acidobacteriota bacterium]